MNISVDLSMYPLSEAYEDIIIAFIKKLRKSQFQVVENGLSTQISGPYLEVMDFLRDSLGDALADDENCVFVMKVVPGARIEHEPAY